MNEFQLVSSYQPTGDQPAAIKQIVSNLDKKIKEQTLLGVTGSGKTFTMANVISQVNRPTLVLSHNKTLAAQLYSELKEFFPHNAVEYFVSYYDYYQPEAFIPQSNTYIEKDAAVNDDLDKLRIRATGALLSRKDVIIVASVSAIYGLGSPVDWEELFISLCVGDELRRDDLLLRLVAVQYERTEVALKRGTFRVLGDVVELLPSYSDDGIRLEFFGDEIEAIHVIDVKSGNSKGELEEFTIYPAKHFVVAQEKVTEAIKAIEKEMLEQVRNLRKQGKELEAERLESRTKYDIEMLLEVGYCTGIENYSRHMEGRAPGSRPHTLIDYFKGDALIIIDESHVTIPQIRGMFNGDRARKETLVAHGFRLPSALDNRPLRFEEFETFLNSVVYVSATPGPYEKKKTDVVIEQLIRPTGLLDPIIEVRPIENQIDDLIAEIKKEVKRGNRILVTTLTKRMSEDLSTYLANLDILVQYLHSEMDAIERMDVLRKLRTGEFDCLVGINLLREGLDLPEVALVAILDADKEGFLRSEVALIQTVGRAARNVEGRVIFYADRITDSMENTMRETRRRREVQEAFNTHHNITPQTIQKAIHQGIEHVRSAKTIVAAAVGMKEDEEEIWEQIRYLEQKMYQASSLLEFDQAAKFRDKVFALKKKYGLS